MPALVHLLDRFLFFTHQYHHLLLHGKRLIDVNKTERNPNGEKQQKEGYITDVEKNYLPRVKI